ncbi:Fe-S cluster assembly protein SufD [Rivularia sp. UHCC 0363]|uniref:Fe-S cluster assembly protein SufD n=1 Tax=Rivularia sp. UHCC 0363 TaxID=3110244 RepID=UPI002B1F3299|nr:Fe-S cluster assembly protein SufD [Rivularia sp. UHCC 0363]MEA5598289.1 Fe-S cluster assembly protein SufD [Rivularia sp. UHCC 0363]
MNIEISSIPNSREVSLSDALLNKDAYLTGLVDKVSVVKSEGWLQQLKDDAANWVRHSTLPTKKDEEWRFTDLSALRQHDFKVDTKISPDSAPFTAISDTRLVFVNGVFVKELSAIADLPDGVVVSNLSGLPNLDGELVKAYLAQAEGAKEVFTALNTAGINDLALIWLSRDVIVETSIHLVFISTDKAISQPRCLVVAKSGSEVTFVEEFISGNPEKDQQEVYLNNSVTEIWVDENAKVNHTRIERDSVEAFHIGKTVVTQARNSRYTCNAIALGGKLSRHNLEILQTGEQTETILNGLTMISGSQLSDTHSTLALNHPYSNSKQLQKNIIADKAHGVFNGKIFVPKPAQLTDASQLNRNLLLSPQARIDTKPQLEITADNVKCAHGATVSQLEDDEIFYLQSRGIDENNARHLLINAFAAEIINKIPIPSLRQNLTQTANEF